MITEFKAVFVHEDTHRDLSILKAQEGLTFDEMVSKLIMFYKENTAE